MRISYLSLRGILGLSVGCWPPLSPPPHLKDGAAPRGILLYSPAVLPPTEHGGVVVDVRDVNQHLAQAGQGGRAQVVRLRGGGGV